MTMTSQIYGSLAKFYPDLRFDAVSQGFYAGGFSIESRDWSKALLGA